QGSKREQAHRSAQQSTAEQLSWINPADQHSDHGHSNKRPDASRRHRYARLNSGIGKNGLQKEREQDKATVKDKSERRHKEDTDAVSTLLKNPKMNNFVMTIETIPTGILT